MGSVVLLNKEKRGKEPRPQSWDPGTGSFPSSACKYSLDLVYMKHPAGGAWEEEEEDGGVSTARWGELPKGEGGAKAGLESHSSSLEGACSS
ncbi:unnamed protein product [Caretta caretta]